MGIHALAQRGARRHGTDAQRALEEGVTAKGFNGVEVVLALYQQAQVALEDVAVGDAANADGKPPINPVADAKAFDVLPSQGQTSIRAEVVGQFFDNEVGHVEAHLQGELYMTAKCLISMGKQVNFDEIFTDSGDPQALAST